jgi:small nuclear ribonucleoprotein (snRNP)-like protein
MTIDLSKYIGQEVVATLANGSTLVGVVKFNNVSETYPYVITVWLFDRNGEGFTMPNITSITTTNPSMNGIAQRHPNINLSDFEGQNVYFKCMNGNKMFGTVVKSLSSDRCYVNIPCGGSFITSDIQEIYGEGAYEIRTKQTFDEPSDTAVEKAKEAIKDLTEEQIAKLLHSLKK